MTLVLRIPGEPIAAPRPRVSGKRTYDPKAAIKKEHAAIIRDQLPDGFVPWDGPVSLACSFLMPVRKSMTKAQKDDAANGRLYHTKLPDCDNLLKHVMDVLTQAGVWKDDSVVCSLSANKVYAHGNGEPGTAITMYVIKPRA